MSYGGWQPYVPVAQRRAKAAREMNKLRKNGTNIEPIEIHGRKIARTFWGEAWCKHLERFSDFSNRLPRGRTYVRNGSVCHLTIKPGKVEAIVSGSALYNVSINIASLTQGKWKKLRKQCTGQIGSILELLQGRLSTQVMGVVTHPTNGLFPQPGEIKLQCDCPDWADMCKHVAAVLYGVGARLDEKPELLFKLRKVDQNELISANLELESATGGQGQRRRLANQDLSALFDIDIEGTDEAAHKRKAPARKTSKKKTASGSSKTRTGKAKKSVNKKTFTPTGAAVIRLRKQFNMTRPQFADLLGISPQTVANWETKRGKLKLREHTLTALTRAWLHKQS